ncbi:MAG: glycosyl transferase family 2 [Rickettsiales bacterium]|nr:glycosyl transferase family 2 [Rickettsiales bacterium]
MTQARRTERLDQGAPEPREGGHLRLLQSRAPRVLILIPCLNEGPRIGALLREVHKLHPGTDILVVDDGSQDDSVQRARAAGAEVLQLPFHLGYGAALQTGYRYALDGGYDVVVQMDGDGQHPADEIATLLGALQQSGCDLVIGSRFLGRRCYRIPGLRRLGISLFSKLVSCLAGRQITDPTSGFQAMNRRMLSFYQQDFYPYDYPDADLLLRVHYEGLSFQEQAVEMLAGPPGKSMHSGLSPIYYVYKLLLSLGLTWLSGSLRRSPLP